MNNSGEKVLQNDTLKFTYAKYVNFHRLDV